MLSKLLDVDISLSDYLERAFIIIVEQVLYPFRAVEVLQTLQAGLLPFMQLFFCLLKFWHRSARFEVLFIVREQELNLLKGNFFPLAQLQFILFELLLNLLSEFSSFQPNPTPNLFLNFIGISLNWFLFIQLYLPKCRSLLPHFPLKIIQTFEPVVSMITK
jgi:hypothetical protein